MQLEIFQWVVRNEKCVPARSIFHPLVEASYTFLVDFLKAGRIITAAIARRYPGTLFLEKVVGFFFRQAAFGPIIEGRHTRIHLGEAKATAYRSLNNSRTRRAVETWA